MKDVEYFLIFKSSPASPFKNVSSLFARYIFQCQAGNLPHIHTIIKINWNGLHIEGRNC